MSESKQFNEARKRKGNESSNNIVSKKRRGTFKEILATLIERILNYSRDFRESFIKHNNLDKYSSINNVNLNYPEAIFRRLEYLLDILKQTQENDEEQLEKINKELYSLLKHIPVDANLLEEIKHILPGSNHIETRVYLSNILAAEKVKEYLEDYKLLLWQLKRYQYIQRTERLYMTINNQSFLNLEQAIRRHINTLRLALSGSLIERYDLERAKSDFDKLQKLLHYTIVPIVEQLNNNVRQSMAKIYRNTEKLALPPAIISVLANALESKEKFKKFIRNGSGNYDVIYSFYDNILRQIGTSHYILQKSIININNLFSENFHDTNDTPKHLGALILRQDADFIKISEQFHNLLQDSWSIEGVISTNLQSESKRKYIKQFIYSCNKVIENYFILKDKLAILLKSYVDFILKIFRQLQEKNCAEAPRDRLQGMTERITLILQPILDYSNFLLLHEVILQEDMEEVAYNSIDDSLNAFRNLLKICQITVSTNRGEIGANSFSFSLPQTGPKN